MSLISAGSISLDSTFKLLIKLPAPETTRVADPDPHYIGKPDPHPDPLNSGASEAQSVAMKGSGTHNGGLEAQNAALEGQPEDL